MHSRILLGLGIFGLAGCGVFGSDGGDGPAPAVAAADPPARDEGDAAAAQQLPDGAPPPAVGRPDTSELTEMFGVFVTPTGTADGDGTRQHPFATITAGIERVKDLKLRVYVCGGTYKEAISLVNAVSVIGSLSCDGGMWKTGGARTILAAPTSPAVRAKDIALVTRLDGLDVLAPAGAAGSPNSIALIAENASALTVANSKLIAAKAFDGVDGTTAIQLSRGMTLAGADGLELSNLLANPVVGPQPHLGGAGGVGSCVGAAGHDGGNGKQGGSGATEICTGHLHPITGVYDWTWEAYVRAGVTFSRSDGAAGASTPGATGSDGSSASKIGSFTPDGYSAADGTDGADGTPGPGGSGGNGAPTTIGTSCGASGTGSNPAAGKIIYDATGAGGGAGGCPGLAGKAGTGGGASIAALVFASPGLSLTTCELVAGDAGKGGSGAFPSAPTSGGVPGWAPPGTTFATAGGPGGRAGFSGNGAGGPSIALAHTGGEIVVAPDTHLTAGNAGAGVPDRSTVINGSTVTIPASVAGTAMPILAF